MTVESPPPVDPCAGTPAIGTVCTGGAIYAGTFDPLDGGGVKKYMTTPADAGLKIWGPSGTTGANSTTDGVANTINLEARGSAYVAGYYCGTLTANGYSDWFLPAQDELNLFYISKVLIGGFDISGTYPTSYYLISNETIEGPDYAWAKAFNNGSLGVSGNATAMGIRCARRY